MELVRISWEKRTFDVFFSLVILICTAPFWLFMLLMMLLEFLFIPSSRGGVLYAETRISQGRPFTLYKFRVFKRAALEQAMRKNGFVQTKELEQKAENLTHVGVLLRQIYMDELPQLINILKGEMSLVGPRPTNVHNYQRLLGEGKRAKFLCRAGLTGYFQTHKGLKMNKDQEQLDMEYAEFCKNNPGWKVACYDAKILAISVSTILRAEGT